VYRYRYSFSERLVISWSFRTILVSSARKTSIITHNVLCVVALGKQTKGSAENSSLCQRACWVP